MGDQDFNFRPPVQRREPKQFEPPPWEADAFDELSRAKAAEQEAAETAAAERAAAEQRAAEEPVAPLTTVAAETEHGDAERAPVETSVAAPAGEGATAQPKVSEAEITEMLAGLRAEEPTSMRSYGTVAIVLSVFTGLLGVVMLVWAMAMFVSSSARGTGRVGVVSGSIVAIFGALFIGLSMWVAVRTLRQRGVL